MIRIVYEKHINDIKTIKATPEDNFEIWCMNNGKEYLLDEWSDEDNIIKPSQIKPECNYYATWVCPKCGNKYDATPHVRIGGLGNCPNCTPRNKSEKISLYDWCIKNNREELLDEWDTENNMKRFGKTPKDFMWFNYTKVSWICPNCNMPYDKEIAKRTKEGKGCPYCSSTKKKVRTGQNDFETQCKQSGQEYLLDEWDYDRNLNDFGITPKDVAQRCTQSVWWKCSEGHTFKAKINVMSDGKPCPYCTDKLVWPGYNDLETWCNENDRQDILDSWNYDKNSKSPSEILYMDTKKEFWWRCPEGHTYHATANQVIHDKASCQKCTNREIETGYNDLETLCREEHKEYLLDEWDYEENEKLGITPQTVGKSYQPKVWWKCSRDHHYAATIPNRFRNQSGCPICRNLSKASVPEKLIYYYVNKAFGDKYEVQCNNRKTLENRTELDIYIPALKIAIEYDGSRYHDSNDRIREITKNERCKELGIELIRVRETGLSNMNDCYCILRNNNNAISPDMDECVLKVLEYIYNKVGAPIPQNICSPRSKTSFINCSRDKHDAQCLHAKM